MDEVKVMFAKQFSYLRKQQNLTQEQASERLATSSRCVQKWERGDSLPDFLHLLFLIYILKFDIYTFTTEVFANGCLSSAKG